MSLIISEILIVPDGIGLDASKDYAKYVARGLASIGMKVREHISVCPDSSQLRQAVATALSRSNVVVILGGMGPKSGYLVKTVLSRGLALPLEESEEALSAIWAYCRKTGEEFLPGDKMLAMLPKSSTVFPCLYGKLPGCAISSAKQHIIMLPETPEEIAPMFNKYVSPYLGGASTSTVTRTIRVYGLKEKDISKSLGGLMNAANPAVTLHPDEGEVLVRVSANAASPQQAAAMCTPVLQDIADKLGDAAYGLDVDSMQSAVVQKLEKKGLEISVAEGGDGGVFTRVITETPGGHGVLRYLVSIDTLEAKEKALGLRSRLIKKRGNVSEFTAIAAAAAVREKGGTDLGVAILANTGKDNAKDCPKGTVYIAVCDENDVYVKKLVVGSGSAETDTIIDAALSRALNMVRLVADYHPRRYTSSIPLSDALNGLGVTELDAYDQPRPAKKERAKPKEKPEKKTLKRSVSVKRFVLIAALLVFLGSSGYIGWHYFNAYTAAKQAEDLQNMFEYGDMEDAELSPDFPKGYSYKFAGLWNANPDVVAFISIDGTKVKYPIVQAEDNEYYLRRDFYGKNNKYGVPFMDYRADIKRPSDNLVVYGHNMRDGQIFGELIEYKNLDFYKEHPVIDFATVYDEKKYKIFSVFITNTHGEHGQVFNYHDFIDAENSEDFTDYISEVTKRSLIKTTVDITQKDELLTLSTCTYEFTDARLVIVARAVRKNESAEVDVEDAEVNPAPLMPDVWYETFGGEKPDDTDVYQIWPLSVEAHGLAAVYLGERADSDEELAQLAQERADARAYEAEEHRRRLEEERAASEAEELRKAEEERAASEAEEQRKAEEERAASEAEEQRKAEEERAASEAEELRKAEEEKALREAEEEAEAQRKAEEEQAALEAEEEEEAEEKKSLPVAKDGDVTVTVSAGGSVYRNADALDIVSRIVQSEVGSSFHVEAIKAQAVAAYTFIKNANASGTTPYVGMSSKADKKVVSAVAEVLGVGVYYKGKFAFTPYHATSGGMTNSSKDVWGGSYPYLVAVDSSVDAKAPYYAVKTTMTSKKVAEILSNRLGIKASGDPSKWFEVLTYTDGGYNGKMSVCGKTKSQITGNTLTGRLMRESVLNLRSAMFDIDYDSDSGNFYFTTYGYGHGVGLSQNGANLYAKQGMDYVEILEHYYPGATVE